MSEGTKKRTLLERVNDDIGAAMRAQDQGRLGPLRMLKAALVNRRVEKGRDPDEAEAVQVVATLVKQRRDAIEQFTRGGRQDLADRETAEIEVLQAYLPPAATADEIRQAIEAAVAETGAAGPKDVGRVMKAAMGKFAGQTVDGRAVNELVRRRLGG